jgi:lipoic acid synthetase
VFNHNLETVRSLQKTIRPAASYECSLRVLAYVAKQGGAHGVTKSGLMVGLGESDEDVYEAMNDLRQAGVAMLTIGQYLAPSAGHAPVKRYVAPEQFVEFSRRGQLMGFTNVVSAPLVRSSYMAGRQFHGEGKAAGHCG